MSNNVEYCRIVGIFGTFLVIFTCFLHYSTLTNKKTNNYSFWIDFSDTNQIIYSFWFVSIRHYSTYYGKSSLIIRFDSFRFDSFYDSNHLFFDSFRFVLGYRLYRFDSVTNRITKSTIRPSLLSRSYWILHYRLSVIRRLVIFKVPIDHLPKYLGSISYLIFGVLNAKKRC